MIFVIFIYILFLSGTQSFTINIQSDILGLNFFETSASTPYEELFDETINDSEQYNLKKCILSLKEIVNRYPYDLDLIAFFESWGEIPSGISFGNTYDPGNFDQCVGISKFLNSELGTVYGQYCLADVLFNINYATTQQTIHTGVCIPDTCSPKFFESVVRQSFYGSKLESFFLNISTSYCTTGKTPPLKPINIAAITVFSFVGLLMVSSTIYDFFISHSKQNPVPVLLAFSILTNAKKIFAISTKKSPNNIDCLNGMRVCSMLFIINHHIFSNLYSFPMINSVEYWESMFTLGFMLTLNGSMIVDTFFFIGGLLVAWSGLRQMDRSKGKLDFLMNDVHRYLRLTPVIAAGLFFSMGINELIYNGPFKELVLSKNDCNGKNWWPIVLYFQNYFYQPTAGRCYDETWYLAVDFQLYILSPLVLIPMWKWGKKFAPALLLIIGISSGWAMGVYFVEGYGGTSLYSNSNEWAISYITTHTRLSPWVIGFGLGYFMHVNRQKTFQISKVAQYFAWIVSIIVMVLIVYIPSLLTNSTGKTTVFVAAIHEGLRRIFWASALAWITFACHHGFGGLVDTFLSHPFWQPLGRLTYCMYLTHAAIIRLQLGILRTPVFFSTYSMLFILSSTFGISMMVATVMSLAFELPILILENFIFGKDKKATTVATVSPNIANNLPQKDV